MLRDQREVGVALPGTGRAVSRTAPSGRGPTAKKH